MSVSNVGSVHAQIHQELIEENEKLTKQLEVLKKENERLKGIEKDHRTDWMRIQNAERKCEDLQKENEELKSDYWYRKAKGAENIEKENKHIHDMLTQAIKALEKLELYISYNGDTWVRDVAREALSKLKK